MTTAKIKFIVQLIIYCCFTSLNAQDSSNDLMGRLQVFNKAFVEADTAILKQMITTDYLHTNGRSGPYTKEEWIGYVTGHARNWMMAASSLRHII